MFLLDSFSVLDSVSCASSLGGLSRRWPSCVRMILSNRTAPQAPQAKACAIATDRVWLRGKAAKEIPVTPKKTANGAAAAAAWPGFRAL